MRKDLLFSVANLAQEQGYQKAKEAIVKWNNDADVDKYWAMRVAHLAVKFGLEAANNAINNPEQ